MVSRTRYTDGCVRCRARILLLSGWTMVLSASCSDETQGSESDAGATQFSGGQSDDGPPESAAETIQEAVEGYCRQFSDCGCLTLRPDMYASIDACIAEELPLTMNVADAGFAAGLVFDSSCFRARMDRFYRLGCTADLDDVEPPVDCKVSYGEKGVGEACTVYDNAEGDDCAAGLYCWSGVCESPPESGYQAGDRCPWERPFCEGDNVCVDVDDDGVFICEPLPLEGEPCLFTVICGPSLLCSDDKTCVVVPGLGEPCGSAGLECDPCLECGPDGAGGTCGAPAEGAVGAACGVGNGCEQGSWCNPEQGELCSSHPLACWPGADTRPPTTFEATECNHLDI